MTCAGAPEAAVGERTVFQWSQESDGSWAEECCWDWWEVLLVWVKDCLCSSSVLGSVHERWKVTDLKLSHLHWVTYTYFSTYRCYIIKWRCGRVFFEAVVVLIKRFWCIVGVWLHYRIIWSEHLPQLPPHSSSALSNTDKDASGVHSKGRLTCKMCKTTLTGWRSKAHRIQQGRRE